MAEVTIGQRAIDNDEELARAFSKNARRQQNYGNGADYCFMTMLSCLGVSLCVAAS